MGRTPYTHFVYARRVPVLGHTKTTTSEPKIGRWRLCERRIVENFDIPEMRIVTINHLDELRRSAMSIAANAPWTFLKLRRSGMLFVDSRTHRITALLFSQPPTPFQSPGFVLGLTKGWNLSIQKKILPE